MTQNEVSIGRGGDDLWVDLALYTTDEISREHLRLRRDPASGAVQDHGPEPQRNLAERPPHRGQRRGRCCPTARKSRWRKS